MNEELKVVISAEIDDLKRNVKAAKEEVEDFSSKTKISFSEFNDAFQKAGDVSKNILGGFAAGVGAVATAAVGVVKSTEEYRAAQGRLNTAFEAAGSSAAQATETYNGLYRVLGDGDKATEAAGHLAKLTTEEKALNEWTTICQGVYGTFGDSLPIESLTEAANETAKTGALTGALADALNWAGVSEDDFQAKLDACNTEAEREQLIRGTLNGLYDDAAVAYEKNNAEILAQNEAQANLDATMANLGATLAPIITDLTSLATDVLAVILPDIQDFMNNHGDSIKEFLKDVGEKVGNILKWIGDNWEFVSTLAGIIIGIAAAISVVSTVMAVVNAVTAASPVTWIVLGIVAAIAALTAAIILVVKNWDKIKEKTKEVVDKIKNWVVGMKDKVVEKFTEIKDGITNKIQEVKTNITNKFAEIKKKITTPIENAKNTVKGIVDKIKGFFKFEWSLPKLKVPKFAISPAGWKVGDLLKGSIPKLSVAWNAQGGVFDKPTIFPYGNSLQGLGEAGAEAIVPLEKNTKWLEIMADKIAARQGNTPIVLEVDGKVFAQTSIKTINDLTKQTGALQLKLV